MNGVFDKFDVHLTNCYSFFGLLFYFNVGCQVAPSSLYKLWLQFFHILFIFIQFLFKIKLNVNVVDFKKKIFFDIKYKKYFVIRKIHENYKVSFSMNIHFDLIKKRQPNCNLVRLFKFYKFVGSSYLFGIRFGIRTQCVFSNINLCIKYRTGLIYQMPTPHE